MQPLYDLNLQLLENAHLVRSWRVMTRHANQADSSAPLVQARKLRFEAPDRLVLHPDEAEVDEAPVLSHHECGVGKWIYGHTLAAYGHLPEMRELERVPADIHTSARRLVGLLDRLEHQLQSAAPAESPVSPPYTEHKAAEDRLRRYFNDRKLKVTFRNLEMERQVRALQARLRDAEDAAGRARKRLGCRSLTLLFSPSLSPNV